jgi:hypothetical protein
MNFDGIVSTLVQAVQRHGGTISQRTNPSVIAELENRLSFRIPYFYRELIDNYEFLPLEIGSLDFFGAFGARDDPDDTGSYDPVCVDLSYSWID